MIQKVITFFLSCCNRNGKTESNPFDDDHEEWEDYTNDALVDNGEPGIPVRALYDYEGAESDELSFKTGNCHSNCRKFSQLFSRVNFNILCLFTYSSRGYI